MNIKNILIILNLFLVSFLFSQEMELVKRISNGSDKNSLLFGNEYADPDNRTGPNGITFDELGFLHINDTWNERIVLLDKSFEVSKIIPVPGGHITLLADSFTLLPEGYLCIYSKDRFSLIDRDGKNIFYYNFQLNSLRGMLSSNYDQIIYHGYFFKKTTDDRIFCILPPVEGKSDTIGEILWDNDVYAMFGDGSHYDMGDLILDSNGFLILNGKIYSNDYNTLVTYWAQLKGYSDFQEYRNDKSHVTRPFNPSNSELYFIGRDNDSNTYWCLANRWIQVISEDGSVLIRIEYDRTKSNDIPTVSPSGELYFLAYSKEGHSLYRIKRYW